MTALQGRWPGAAKALAEAEDDVLAYMAIPQDHWTRFYSTNPLERFNREVKRRTDIVGVFPDHDAIIQLAVPSCWKWRMNGRLNGAISVRTACVSCSNHLQKSLLLLAHGVAGRFQGSTQTSGSALGG